MNMYIPADKLIAEIEQRLSEIPTPKVRDSNSIENFYRRDELLQIKNFACSLQQEQPKFKVGDTIHRKGENTVFPIIIEGISDGDYVCDGGKCFVNIKFQDDYELVPQAQPETDFEDKFAKFLEREDAKLGAKSWSEDDLRELAMYFYFDRNNKQPEVELDAEIAIYLNRNVLNRINNSDIIEDFTTIEAGELAQYFYELGLSARKDDNQ